MLSGVASLVLVSGCTPAHVKTTCAYTRLSEFNPLDLEHDPGFERLKRRGWTFVCIEETEGWVGGADRQAGHYALFRRQRETP